MQLDGPALRLLDELIGELGVFLVLRAERAGVCDVLIGFQRSILADRRGIRAGEDAQADRHGVAERPGADRAVDQLAVRLAEADRAELQLFQRGRGQDIAPPQHAAADAQLCLIRGRDGGNVDALQLAAVREISGAELVFRSVIHGDLRGQRGHAEHGKHQRRKNGGAKTTGAVFQRENLL